MGRSDATAPPYLAVVRRGETEVYRTLEEYLGRRGLVHVMWDRRVGERRRVTRPRAAGPDRRAGERRRDSPRHPAYRTLGFFLTRPARAER